MAQSPDHPELVFVEAAGYTTGRPDGPPLWIVVHDMEAGETRLTAENTAAYFANPTDGRNVSSHYTADSDSIVQCVLLKDSAWTVGNRPGNNRGINWEFSGFASQTRAQWLDDFGRAMFAQAAPYIRSDAARFGIPLERRTVAELQTFKSGVTCHNDLRLAFGRTTHTDPGPNFPWDYFMTLLEEDQMALSNEDVEKVRTAVWFTDVEADAGVEQAWRVLDKAGEDAAAAAAGVAELVSRPPVEAGPVDVAALQAAVEAAVAAQIPAIVKAVNDDSARRAAE